jgi:hypothetical protein
MDSEQKIEEIKNENFIDLVEQDDRNANDQQLESYTLADIEDYLTKGITPPGIKVYNDLPSSDYVQPTESKIEKIKKPWETDENKKSLNFLEDLEEKESNMTSENNPQKNI